MTPCKAFGHTEGRDKTHTCVTCRRMADRVRDPRHRETPLGIIRTARYRANENLTRFIKRHERSI